ncbi:MAG: hypothetical protein WEF50_04705 [Myxococcota bacterium]
MRLWRLAILSALLLPPQGAALASDALRGPPEGGAPTQVAVGVFVSDVNAVTEEDETFEFEGILTASWRDPRLAFDPARAGVSEKVYQGNYQFAEVFDGWWPQLFLSNESGQFEDQYVLVRVAPEGQVTWTQEFNAVAEMPMNLRRFPFDRQRFEAIFEVLGFGPERVVLVADPATTGATAKGVSIAQWILHGVDVSARNSSAPYQDGRADPLSQLVVALDMAREPGHLLRMVVAPLVLLVLLTSTVFWMDRESLGDRMDISFIGILSVVAYQIVVNDHMPAIAYPTLMFGFLYSTYLLLTASVLMNLVVSKLDQSDRRALGDRVDRACRWLFPLSFLGLNVVNAVYFLGFD